MTDRKFCDGCDNDFYNGKNPHGIPKCWHLDTAKVVTRYRIGWWIAPTDPGAFTKVQTHHCHTASGRYALFEKLPECAVGVRSPADTETKKSSGVGGLSDQETPELGQGDV